MRKNPKNKVRNEELHLSIKCDYKKALIFLKRNDLKTANRVLYEDMNPKLYDLSLDILYNRNHEFADQGLRSLIEEVHVLLDLSEDKDFQTDLLDDYNNNF